MKKNNVRALSIIVSSLILPYLLHAESVVNVFDSEAAQGEYVSEPIKNSFLTEFSRPWEIGDPNEKIQFLFENADLSTLIDYIATRFGLTFILDDAIKPLPQGGKSIVGSKISFRTHDPMSKKEAWSIFTTFLDLAGIAVIPGPSERIFKLAPTDPKSPLNPSKNPLPLYIDTGIADLPDTDAPIRYIAFVRNTSLDAIVNIVNEIKSPSSPRTIVVPDIRALIITDKSSLIKSMLHIIDNLDQPSSSEILKILKLDRIDATKAVALYKDLVKTEDQSLTSRLLGQRKKPHTNFFSENVRLTAVPHLNSIVLIGTREAVQRVYDFIKKTLDRVVDQNHVPIFTYPLKHTNSEEIARILNSATKFQMETEAAKSGGVRDGDKYFKPVFIEAEKSGNRLIITADYEDYTKIDALLKRIDVEQPQVALKVLVLNLDLTESKELGSQLRNKFSECGNFLGKNVNFQTSGFAGTGSSVVENSTGTGAERLLGDLINLAQLPGNLGSTLLTLGSDAFGVWGMLKFLETYAKLSIIANPFLVTTNKFPATLSVGTTRRIVDANIENGGNATTQTFKDLTASLDVKITPQITRDGLISLDVFIGFSQFTSDFSDPNNVANGNRNEKNIQTSVIVSDNEVLALGGLVRDDVQEVVSKVPVLGDIPLIGNLFKNSSKRAVKTSLLVVVIPQIIPPYNTEIPQILTEEKLLDTQAVFQSTYSERRDPLLRWFFGSSKIEEKQSIQDFMGVRNRYLDESQKYQTTQNKQDEEPPSPTILDALYADDANELREQQLNIYEREAPSSKSAAEQVVAQKVKMTQG